jgi:hypothetical protein
MAAGTLDKFMARNMKGTSRCSESNFDKQKHLFSIHPSGAVLEHHGFGHQETYPPVKLLEPFSFPTRKPHSGISRSQRHPPVDDRGHKSLDRRFGSAEVRRSVHRNRSASSAYKHPVRNLGNIRFGEEQVLEERVSEHIYT